MNKGLMLISPIVLVRLLTVEDFGRYREFLLYATLLASLSAFGVNTSLLRFVPHQPEHGQRFINQALLMTLASSTLVIGGVAALNAVFGGALVGEYVLPLGVYVALLVNFDFWEHLWLAQRRTGAVFAYTMGRLVARMAVVIAAAAVTADVNIIIWSLVCMEAARLVIAVTAWSRLRERRLEKLPGSWREQLQFCLPFGAALVLVTLNKSMGSLFIAKMMGPVALAHYAIGAWVQPVITVLRNSMSDALLPEMSAQQPAGQKDDLLLWKRMTVIAAIFLTAAALILAKFAEVIVVTLFSAEYRPAVVVFQIYLLVLLREILDFGVPLRAINRTGPIMRSNLLSIALNIALLAMLLPVAGVAGAAAAFVISRMIEGAYLAVQTARAWSIAPRELAKWGDLAKVALAAALASVTLYGSFWSSSFGLFGVVAGATCFLLMYCALLFFFRVPEAVLLMHRFQQLPRAFLTRCMPRRETGS